MAQYKGANQQRQRNEDHLVNKGPFRYAPHHRQLTVRPHAADLLRVQRQIISQYPGGFFRRQFSHNRNVIQQGGDIIQQC